MLRALLPERVLYPALAAVSLAVAASAANADEPFTSYHIGNSLTVDSLVSFHGEISENAGINHEVGYHIRSSQSLTYIYDNPTDNTFVAEDTGPWNQALPNNAWDVVTLQIHPTRNTTLGSDRQAIANLIGATQSNPANANTRFVLFGAWPRTPGDYAASWNAPLDYNGDATAPSHTDAYQRALFQAARENNPGVQIELIQTGKLLAIADQAIKEQVALGQDWFGLTDIDQLYRDEVHLNFGIGRYLAAVTLWAATTGEDPNDFVPPSFWGPEHPLQTDLELRQGLNAFVSDNFNSIQTVPEPSSLAVFGLTYLLIRRRRQAV